ncbi:glutamic acid-rich protein-like [Juglans microcarpa x Juglans regia]|uniref:glutamic acid-rich protein-like n=1 Tax=Juglans microcarpa x Juglans regia TaxID=2249226 RepID=UPI001B7DC4C3|nr:glutamic acid-rich protein-like [Juglans microcarpa x Juglans regia]
MEEQKSRSKQDMKRNRINLRGGDGIGGVVVFGGALAIAGLIAVFAFKNRRMKDADNNPRNPSDVSKESKNNKREDEGSEGLRFISQTSYYASCLTSHGTPQTSVTQIDPCETLVSAKSLIMEEKPRNEISEENEDPLSGHQEIVICDYSTLESSDSCDDCGVMGKCSLPVPESPILIEETMVKNDSDMEENNSISIKTIEDEKANEPSLIVHAEDKAEHEKSTTQSDEEDSDEESLLYKEDEAEHEKSATQSDEEEEEERDDEEGGIVEEGEESSEGTTGDSSMESNTEAIWPAELILDSSQEMGQTDFIFQNAVEKTEKEEDETAKLVKRDYFNSTENGYALKYEAAEKPPMIWKETHKPVKVNNQPTRSSKLGMWVFSIIMLLLLLLLAFNDQKAVPTPAMS